MKPSEHLGKHVYVILLLCTKVLFDIYFSQKRFLKNSRIPFDTLGITSTNTNLQSHLLGKGFHYSPFHDIVKGSF